jgi:glycosyltransferase involved in cell wall biosynthesis
MKRIKISFLIAAHNEEKIIEKTLKNLIKLPYKNYEVVIGLDGCTDNTEGIVQEYCKKSERIRYYKLNLRQGKPAVINSIIKKASGDIIIINDADWIFKVKDSKTFQSFVNVFVEKKIGGISESFPVEWNPERFNKTNWVYNMVAYSSMLWLSFQKKKFTFTRNKIRLIKQPRMFLTNIFRKELYQKNFSLGDDFERTHYIMEQGYDIAIFEDINMPRMIAVYDSIDIKDFMKQKIRTAIARDQIENKQKLNETNYYYSSIFYIFKNSWRSGFKTGLVIILWVILTSIATLISKFKTKNTKEGWKLRARR